MTFCLFSFGQENLTTFTDTHCENSNEEQGQCAKITEFQLLLLFTQIKLKRAQPAENENPDATEGHYSTKYQFRLVGYLWRD